MCFTLTQNQIWTIFSLFQFYFIQHKKVYKYLPVTHLPFLVNVSHSGSSSTHGPHVMQWQGEAPGALVSEGSAAPQNQNQEARVSTGGKGVVWPQPWTTNKNWLKNSPSSMRGALGCWYAWTTLRRWGERGTFDGYTRNKELLVIYIIVFVNKTKLYLWIQQRKKKLFR